MKIRFVSKGEWIPYPSNDGTRAEFLVALPKHSVLAQIVITDAKKDTESIEETNKGLAQCVRDWRGITAGWLRRIVMGGVDIVDEQGNEVPDEQALAFDRDVIEQLCLWSAHFRVFLSSAVVRMMLSQPREGGGSQADPTKS